MRLIEPVVVTDTGSFSRASTGTYHDKDGVLQTAAVDEPRWNYNPADLTQPPVLLVEAAATNLCIRSSEFDSLDWGKSNLTVTPNAEIAPDGTLSADILTDANVTQYGSLSLPSVSAVSGEIFCVALFVLKDNIPRTTRFSTLRLAAVGVVGSKYLDIKFDTSTGEYQIAPAFATALGGGVIDAGAYWRFWIAGSVTDSALTGYRIDHFPAVGASATWAYAVSATGSITAYGMQLERGSKPTSYIPTTTAAVTRAADVLGGMLVTNVPENDYTEYSDITTYAIGDRCMVTSAAQHNVYTSVTAGNLDNDPALEPDPVNAPINWQFVGKTNRWKPFDGYVSSQASLADRLLYSIKIPDGVMTDSVALMNIDAEFAGITVTDDVEGQIYQNEFNLISESGITDYWEYFFAPIRRQANLTLTGLDVYAGVRIDVEMKDDGGTPKCGALVGGISYDIGDTRYGLSMSSTDYSVKTVDAFGNITLTQRPYSNDMELSAWVLNANMAEVNAKLISRRATPTIFIGAPDIYDEATAVYGWVESWGNVVEYQSYSILSINIKGLT